MELKGQVSPCPSVLSAALPPDVRKGYAFPLSEPSDFLEALPLENLRQSLSLNKL